MSLIPKYRTWCKYCHSTILSETFKDVCDKQECKEKERQFLIDRMKDLQNINLKQKRY